MYPGGLIHHSQDVGQSRPFHKVIYGLLPTLNRIQFAHAYRRIHSRIAYRLKTFSSDKEHIEYPLKTHPLTGLLLMVIIVVDKYYVRLAAFYMLCRPFLNVLSQHKRRDVYPPEYIKRFSGV